MDRRDVLKLAAATALVGVPTVAVAAPKRELWEDGSPVVVTFCVTRMHPLKMAEEVQRLTDEIMADNPGWAYKADPNIAWPPAKECTDWWSELDLEILDLEAGRAEGLYNTDGYITLRKLAYPAPPPDVSSWKTNTRQCVSKIQPRDDETGGLLRSLLRGTYALWTQNAPHRAIVSTTITHFVYRQDPNAPIFRTQIGSI